MKIYYFAPFLVCILVLLITIFFPFSNDSVLLTSIVGVATFLFGIFIAFSISDRYGRLETIREQDSMERSRLVLLYNLSKVFGKQTQEKIKEVIDRYLQSLLDYEIWDYHKTEDNFRDLADTVSNLEPKTEKQTALIQVLFGYIGDICYARKHTISLVEERISKMEWLIFVFLSAIIIVTLILINTGSIISIVIIFALTMSLVLLLIFLQSLDDISWKEEERIFEPYSKAFEAIDLVRYYPEEIIKSKRVWKHTTTKYRVGIFPHKYPNMSGKIIKTVNE